MSHSLNHSVESIPLDLTSIFMILTAGRRCIILFAFKTALFWTQFYSQTIFQMTGTPALVYLPSHEINNDLFDSRAFAGMSGLHPPLSLADLGLVRPPSTSPSPPAATGTVQAEFGPAEGQ